MNAKRTANVGFGLARLAFGTYALAQPERLGATWIGAEDAARPRVQVVLQALGVRDVALGAGTAWGAATCSATPWLAAGVVADLGDIGATIAGRDQLPERAVWSTIAVASAAAGTGVVLIALNR